jgi:hypothetical protein
MKGTAAPDSIAPAWIACAMALRSGPSTLWSCSARIAWPGAMPTRS